MKKILIFAAILLSIAAIALFMFHPYFNSMAEQDYPYEGEEPDLPAFLKNKGDKLQFMMRRAEGIGLKRGIDKNKPLPDRKSRRQAIEQMERQQEALANLPESEQKKSLTAAWTPIGPAPIPNGQTAEFSTPVSGRVSAIAVHPQDVNIVYVGTASGGLYRTIDGGVNWTPMLDNALSLSIGAIAVAPSQPETIYVGTGEGNFAFDSFFGVGVYRIDNASSPSPIIKGPFSRDERPPNGDVFTGRAVSEIVINHVDPSNIWVATTSGVGGIGNANTTGSPLPNRGIYRSFTFRQVGVFTVDGVGLVADLNVRDIALDPLNVDLMVASVVGFGRNNVNLSGLYWSGEHRALINNITWSQTFQFNTSATNPNPNDLAAEFAIHHTNASQPPTIYAATGNGGGRVLRSTNHNVFAPIGGFTWTPLVTNNFCGVQCVYNIAVAVAPNNANRVYLGGQGPPNALAFGISNDTVTSFTRSEGGLHADTHVIAVSPSSPSVIYVGNDGGIYKSVDGGSSWISLNNSQFSATQFMSLAVHSTDPNFTIGGTQDNGTNFYKPDATWTRVDFGDGGNAVIDQNATDTTNVRMYHTYTNGSSLQGYATVSNISQARDGGWTFRGCQSAGANTNTNGIACDTNAVNFYAPLEQGPGNPNTIYYGTDVLYRSSNAGLDHTIASQNPITDGVPISAIGISPQNDNVRIVGQNNGGIWGTTNGSTTLRNLDPAGTVPNHYIARAVIDPNNQNTAYVTLSVFGATSVWKTTNLNNSPPVWTSADGDDTNAIPPVPVNAFAVDPANSNSLYAGTDIGVFVSTNGGTSWTPFGTGLPRVPVFDMAITTGRKLRIATHGRGLWEISLNETGGISINDVSMNEGNTGTTVFNFTVTLGTSSSQIVTVNYATANDTATAGSDYVANSGVVTFNPGETTKTITVQVNGDMAIEPNETFFVNLSNPVNAAISDNQGVGTITNDDSAISINDVSLNEGNSGTTAFTFTVNVTPPSPLPVTVNYSTANGTAVAPGDYVSVPQTLLVFGAGEASKQITVQVNGDTTGEPNETFTVNLSNPSNSIISDNQGIGTIVNDDGCSYSINPTSQNFPVSGGSGTVQVITQSGCAWTAATNNSFAESFLTIGNQNEKDDFISSLTKKISSIFSPASINAVFSNPAPIRIFDFSTASPYPSNITVSGMTGTITDVNVRINNLSHTFPDDIAFLLVSPDNTRKFVLQSDSGGGVDVSNLTYTFDDQAASGIPNDGPMPVNNGSVSPSSVGDDDGMPAPAPALPYSQPPSAGTATLNGTFGGINPNGTWKLFVVDFIEGDEGSIGGGWSLDITTQGGASSFVTVTSGQNGSGNGAVGYAVAQNTTGQPRTAALTIAGQTFTVNQSNTQTRRRFDFDGDGRADIAVFRPESGVWFLLNSAAGFSGVQFGSLNDRIVPADYDGDGRTDIAVYRGGIWFLLQSSAGFAGIGFGTAEDIPVPADYDGDGRADIAVFRPSSGVWFLLQSSGGFTGVQFGLNGDRPAAADYDGDGKADIAVYRGGVWFLLRSQAGFTAVQFGESPDKPVPADYDGDGRTDIAVFRPSSGVWFLLQSSAGFAGFQFGISTDSPAPADFDGDGKIDIAVFRNGVWFLLRSQQGFTAVQFGTANDKPASGAFVP
jgi:subtilisin-like proprotein convertase family protein